MEDIILFWAISALFFLCIELGSPGLFYFLSFFCGSLGALVTAFFCAVIADQLLIFAVTTIAALLLLKTWVKQRGVRSHYHSNIYALCGKHGVIVSEATAQTFGYLSIDGQLWAYKALHDQEILVGQAAQVVDVKGAHLIVTKVQTH